MNNVAIFVEKFDSGKLLGRIQLDRPNQLNALSYSMLDTIYKTLMEWQNNPDITAILIDSSLDKVFCAGGDVVKVREEILNSGAEGASVAIRYFSLEYRLDYLIHNYQKPIIALIGGLSMGGGVGLAAGARYRVGTQHSRLAMPESQIGFFPDVGATYFMRRANPGVAELMTLTGCIIAAGDMLDNQFINYVIDEGNKIPLIRALLTLNMSDDNDHNDQLVTSLLNRFSLSPCGLKSYLSPYFNELTSLSKYTTLQQRYHYIQHWDSQDVFIDKVKGLLASASPLSLHLIHTQFSQSKEMTLAECFQYELTLAFRCIELYDFLEGVRAKLVDKDNQPNWLYQSIDAVSDDCLSVAYSCVWSRVMHPLADLDRSRI